jgi:hypothetical protein
VQPQSLRSFGLGESYFRSQSPKLAHAIVTLAGSAEPPLRFTAGADAV